MAITSLSDLINSAKQKLVLFKSANRTTLANTPFSLFDVAGNPGAGTAAAGNTTNGIVPTDATAGYPAINAFGGSAVGYIGGIEYNASVSGRVYLYDRLFSVGAIAFTGATTTLSSQPSFLGRCPDGAGVGLKIFLEVTTAFVTGNNWTISVTYTNSAGTTGRSTGTTSAFSAANLILGRCFEFPLQAGDTGVSKIESVIVTNGTTAMTAGAFNINVLRPLWSSRMIIGGPNVKHDYAMVGLPIIYADSALFIHSFPDSTSSGTPELIIDIFNN